MKRQFPIFTTHPNLVYLDNAASTQLPTPVINALTSYYEKEHSNVHRGQYKLSVKNTERYESARYTIATLLGAGRYDDVIFTSGTTASLNLIAYSLGQTLKKGDKIAVLLDNHHSNLLPWQRLCQERQLKLLVVPVDEEGRIIQVDLEKMWAEKPQVFAFSHASNVTGVVHPVAKLCQEARKRGVITVVDGAQALPHLPTHIKRLGCDYYAFSGHKTYGPTGIGALIGNHDKLNQLAPLLTGGGMITKVQEQTATFAHSPARFEAGTPNTAAIPGLVASLIWLTQHRKPQNKLVQYTLEQLQAIPKITIVGPKNSRQRIGVISFRVDGLHAHDVAEVLALNEIAVRAGHHCVMPFHNKYKISATTRVSLAYYTSKSDIDRLITVIKEIVNQLT